MNISGKEIYRLCEELFPINRSLTGDGVRETLTIIQKELKDLKIYEIPTGTKCFDWTVPNEWNIKRAFIIDPDGKKVIDFMENNLHVVSYSIPIDTTMSLEELDKHLYSLPEQPDAIPYVTSYYKESWGFCLTHNQRKNLKKGTYKVLIDSRLEKGNLSYGELIINEGCKEEIFLSTYVCHPSMANNELSGPAITTYIAKNLLSMKDKRFTYRIIFIPETIGSIVYLSKNLEDMREKIIAGFNITCVGDNNSFSFLPSRNQNTLADRVAIHALEYSNLEYQKYSFLDRGSDERQYCSPGVDLPVCSVMRSKYGTYKEYHTSLDNLDFISAEGLYGAYKIYKKMIEILETNKIYKCNNLCEPQLGKRGLYPNLGTLETKDLVWNMMNFLAYCDGEIDLLSIADKIEFPIWELQKIVDSLIDQEVISVNK